MKSAKQNTIRQSIDRHRITLIESKQRFTTIVQELCESRGGRPNEPSGFRGRKDLLNHASALVTACP